MPQRGPGQTFVTYSLILIGVAAGIYLTLRARQASDLSGLEGKLIDIECRNLSAAEADKKMRIHGYPGEATWADLGAEDISYRERMTETGKRIRLFTCRLPPAKAAALVVLKPAMRRPLGGRPPADWPWEPTSRLGVPDWWRPAGTQALYQEIVHQDGRPGGEFVSYDPAAQRIWYWSWLRPRWRYDREPWPSWYADALAHQLFALLTNQRHPVVTGGWLHAAELDPRRPDLAGLAWPPGVYRAQILVLPRQDAHRYLLVLHGLAEETLERVLVDQPLHPLPDDGAPPLTTWDFALPELESIRPPAWFAPGPGPRWHHQLILPGRGTVPASRWIAYDRAAKALYVWDWMEREPRGAEVLLEAPRAAEPVPPGPPR